MNVLATLKANCQKGKFLHLSRSEQHTHIRFGLFTSNNLVKKISHSIFHLIPDLVMRTEIRHHKGSSLLWPVSGLCLLKLSIFPCLQTLLIHSQRISPFCGGDWAKLLETWQYKPPLRSCFKSFVIYNHEWIVGSYDNSKLNFLKENLYCSPQWLHSHNVFIFGSSHPNECADWP
jgi:hypothetical protein